MSTSDPFSAAAPELTPHSSARPPTDAPSMPLGAAEKLRPDVAAALPSIEQMTAWANAMFQSQDPGFAAPAAQAAPTHPLPGFTPAASGVEAMPSFADPRRAAAAASAPIVASVPTGLGANELTAPQRSAQSAMPYYFLAPEAPTHTSDLRITKAALAAQPLDAGPGLFDAGAPRIATMSVPYSPLAAGSNNASAPYPATSPAADSGAAPFAGGAPAPYANAPNSAAPAYPGAGAPTTYANSQAPSYSGAASYPGANVPAAHTSSAPAAFADSPKASAPAAYTSGAPAAFANSPSGSAPSYPGANAPVPYASGAPAAFANSPTSGAHAYPGANAPAAYTSGAPAAFANSPTSGAHAYPGANAPAAYTSGAPAAFANSPTSGAHAYPGANAPVPYASGAPAAFANSPTSGAPAYPGANAPAAYTSGAPAAFANSPTSGAPSYPGAIAPSYASTHGSRHTHGSDARPAYANGANGMYRHSSAPSHASDVVPSYRNGANGSPHYTDGAMPPVFDSSKTYPAGAQSHNAAASQVPSGYTSAPHGDLGVPAVPHARGFEVSKVRADFPILHQQINGRPLVWLDNAATTQKPNVVIERLAHFYRFENSNIHRGAHTLAARSTDAYEQARESVRRFLNAGSTEEIVFVRGATEGINLVASSWGGRYIEAGDEVIVSRIEHHSNIIPWKQLCERTGARLRVAEVDDSGQIDLEQYERLFNSHTRLVAFTHVSNALGTILPVQTMTQIAHRHGARVMIDGAQSVCHMPVDVQALDADFYVFSGHKVFGPTGIGVVYGKRALLAAMPPWQGGGNMIADVTFEKTVYQPPPMRFEAGTGNIADAVGLGVALDYLMALGLDNVARHEHDLLEYGTHALSSVPGLHFVGTAKEKAAVLGFVLENKSSEQVGGALAQRGIAVRAGHHCAQPALRRFGHETTVRPSLAMYNDRSDIDALVTALCELQDTWPAR